MHSKCQDILLLLATMARRQPRCSAIRWRSSRRAPSITSTALVEVDHTERRGNIIATYYRRTAVTITLQELDNTRQRAVGELLTARIFESFYGKKHGTDDGDGSMEGDGQLP